MPTTCPDCHGDLRYTVEIVDIYQDEPETREVECAACMARVTAEMWEAVNAELHHAAPPTSEDDRQLQQVLSHLDRMVAAPAETPAQLAARQASWEAAEKDLEDARQFRQILWLLLVAISVGTFIVWAVTR